MKRFATAMLAALASAALCSCGSGRDEGPNGGARLLFVGMDGMDPVLLRRFMDKGKLPNFKRLAERGGFSPLATSMPPQSPVAWSNVISGGEPGVHEIWAPLRVGQGAGGRRCLARNRGKDVEISTGAFVSCLLLTPA